MLIVFYNMEAQKKVKQWPARSVNTTLFKCEYTHTMCQQRAEPLKL